MVDKNTKIYESFLTDKEIAIGEKTLKISVELYKLTTYGMTLLEVKENVILQSSKLMNSYISKRKKELKPRTITSALKIKFKSISLTKERVKNLSNYFKNDFPEIINKLDEAFKFLSEAEDLANKIESGEKEDKTLIESNINYNQKKLDKKINADIVIKEDLDEAAANLATSLFIPTV